MSSDSFIPLHWTMVCGCAFRTRIFCNFLSILFLFLALYSVHHHGFPTFHRFSFHPSFLSLLFLFVLFPSTDPSILLAILYRLCSNKFEYLEVFHHDCFSHFFCVCAGPVAVSWHSFCYIQNLGIFTVDECVV